MNYGWNKESGYAFFFNLSMHQLRLNWSNTVFKLSPLIHTHIWTYIHSSYIQNYVHSLTICMTLSTTPVIIISDINIDINF